MATRPGAPLPRAIVYGPHSSWRLGRSLGIDLLGSGEKLCAFDCVYCELGEGIHHVVRRRVFVTTEALKLELGKVRETDFDYVTFSGSGEPTLALNLGEAIGAAKAILKKPVTVLTNAVLMPREDVRAELARADVIIAKIDAPDDQLYRIIDRPWTRTPIAEIIEAIKQFRREYHGRLALQMMFVAANKHAASGMAEIARDIAADEVELNTPLRECPVPPLSPQEMDEIKRAFAGVKGVRMVYDER
jgi:wyosine [tRNA(Phe)-imidazoG37] synthetase (radical SAM superfamily)